jgi:putative transcriptional regulator
MSAANIMKKTAERTKAQRTKHDWSRADAMTAAERHAAALADPDAQPLTAEDFARMKPVPRVSIIRRAFRLSQEDFAAQFHIPIGTLRDWEQGRKEPDAAAKAYLRVIASEPETVRKALLPRPRPGVMKRKREAGGIARR